jgi:thiol-disulfide isomerase/thioredoxin
MKTLVFQLSVFLIMINSCTPQVEKNLKKFTLNGEINGQDSGRIVLIYWPDTIRIYDTVKILNGRFEFTGKIYEPIMADLDGGNDLNRVSIYLEPQRMQISLSKDKFSEFKMTGSITQNDANRLNKMIMPYYEKILLLRNQSNDINDSIRNSKNGSNRILFEKKAEEIDKILAQTIKKIDSIEIKYVLDNPKSFISAVYLNMLEANEVLSLDSTKSIFKELDNSLKNSRYGKEIIERNRKMENILIGAQAPDFKATDINQHIVTLSQFKGKDVVLLDFWASWCIPCRQSIPHLKKIYEQYHSKGFEVVAVSTDFSKKAWIEAVKQDSTDMWYHIPIAEKYAEGPSKITNDDIYQNYFIQGIPVQMLIDKNGKILYRHMGYSIENELAMDSLLSEIFDN